MAKELGPDAGATNDWMPGYKYGVTTCLATDLVIPKAVLDPDPKVADLVATTGDIREVLFGLISQIYEVQQARVAAASTDILAGMRIVKDVVIVGDDDDETQTKFTCSFRSNLPHESVPSDTGQSIIAES